MFNEIVRAVNIKTQIYSYPRKYYNSFVFKAMF